MLSPQVKHYKDTSHDLPASLGSHSLHVWVLDVNLQMARSEPAQDIMQWIFLPCWAKESKTF